MSLDSATHSLTLEPISFSSGVPVSYRILGLPHGQTGELVLKEHRSIEIWKIRFGGRGRFRGHYSSAEMALLDLQTGKFNAATEA
jgi:hypothetical protein